MYETRVPSVVKGKLCKTVVRSAMMYRSESWALNKRDKVRMEVGEMRM